MLRGLVGGTKPFEYVREWNDQRSRKGWWHSFELPDGTRIDGVCTLQSLKDRIAQFPIPADLSGKRVLDIGTWDGWFAFEMERRGAEVVAIDNWDNPLFHEMHARLQSRAEYLLLDMYELTPERLGRFDIVLFMGVLYHLKHPLLALELVCALTRDMAAVDSFILRDEYRPKSKVDQRPIMEFYETAEFGGQTDNWVGPSLPCLLAFCRTSGFARVELQSVIEHSACIACYRKWNPPSPAAVKGPDIVGAFHSRDFGINFSSKRDEYVGARFHHSGTKLKLAEVRPEVGGYGVNPIDVHEAGPGQMEVGFKLPPGLEAGMHDVAIRVRESQPGDAARIAVDMPAQGWLLSLKSVQDGTTWIPNQIDFTKGDTLSIWVTGLPENADRNNIRVSLGDWRLEVTYIESGLAESRSQINLKVPEEIGPGPWELRLMDGPGLPVHVIHQ